jgi:hypothetical protein
LGRKKNERFANALPFITSNKSSSKESTNAAFFQVELEGVNSPRNHINKKNNTDAFSYKSIKLFLFFSSTEVKGCVA